MNNNATTQSYKGFQLGGGGAKRYNIEFLRFLFSIAIVYFHIFGNIMHFSGTNLVFKHLNYKCLDAFLIVECFLIIAGFFLFQSFKNKPEQSLCSFILNKIARLWPVLAFSILCTVLLGVFGLINVNFYTQFINLFFLQCIGVTFDYKGINWYISPFFWTLIFYFTLLKIFKQKNSNLIIALVVYFSLVGLINNGHGSFGRETFNIFFNGGLMRCLAGVGIGYFIGILYDRVKDCPEIFKTKLEKSVKFLLVSALEVWAFVFLGYHFLFHRIHYANKLIFVIVFSILFFLFIIRQGLLSNITNSKIFGFLGRYSYSIYAMQQVSFYIIGLSLISRYKDFVNSHSYIALSLAIFLTVIIGVLTYHIVEKPVGKFLKDKFFLIFGLEK